jgi:tetratricopeptide (TPR) repeat protein
MSVRISIILCLAALSIFKPYGLNAESHDAFSKNAILIGLTEDSIKANIESNPAKSDSIAKSLLIQLGEQDDYAKGIANYYLGEIAYQLQEWANAADYYQLALLSFTNSGATSRMASASNNLGLVLFYTGQFDKALAAISQSLSIELDLKNDKGIAQSYQNMALILEEAGQTSKAIEFYNEALDLFIKLNDWEDAAGVYNNLAAIFSQEMKFDKAESYYHNALDIYSERGLKAKEASVLCNIGVLLIRDRKFDEGGKLLEQALVMMKANGEKMGEISVYNHLGDLYSAREEFQQAIFLYKTADQLALKLGSADLRLENLYSLYLGYKKAQLFEDALKTHEQYQTLRDSLLNENPTYKQGIVNQELGRQLAERELQNYKSNVREKFYWTALVFLIMVAGSIVFFLMKRRKKAETQINIQNFGQRVTESQMDTHFVFSMLSSLQGHIISGNNEMALDHLNNVAILLRKTFENTGKGLIPLSQEIDFLHAYFSVQNQRFSQEIGFNIVSNIEEADESILVPFMVTKPFIESAITNGLFTVQAKPHFNIAFMRLGNRLEVTIEDNGSSLGNFKNRHLEERLINIGIPIHNGKKHSVANRQRHYAISGVQVEDKAQTGMGSGTRVKFSFPIVNNN